MEANHEGLIAVRNKEGKLIAVVEKKGTDYGIYKVQIATIKDVELLLTYEPNRTSIPGDKE